MSNRKHSSSRNKQDKNDKTESTENLNDNTCTAQENWELIKNDLCEIKQSLKKTVKTCDLEDIVTSIVKGLLEDYQRESKKKESVYQQKIDKLTDDVDRLTLDNETFREKICEGNKTTRELQNEVEALRNTATSAAVRSNYNEQYSRKSNIKIYGVPEKRNENILDVVKSTLKEKGDVNIQEKDVVAVHRIPGSKPNTPRPIILKMINSDRKSHIMRKRSMIKKATGNVRIGDDVTKENSALITRLLDNSNVTSAWYFNGSVFGDVKGKRMRFNIFDDIDAKIGKIRNK